MLSEPRREEGRILFAPPRPYAYGLLSKLIYRDDLVVPMTAGMTKPALQITCEADGWVLQKFVRDENGYIGGIFVREADQQVVIVHRGSDNLESWLTDLETVIQGKPGGFLKSAIELVADPLVMSLVKRDGYRLSHTGHSLGGFLAQICVYWSQQEAYPDTYIPDACAVTFDSPGAADLMGIMQSNVDSERARIQIGRLNIHNFCAMPTIVSTYGRQTGTLWHVKGEGEDGRLAKVMHHKLDTILERFNPAGYPREARQMRDWPQADYGAYMDPASTVIKGAIKLPFAILNAIYRKVRSSRAPTWYDRLVASKTDQLAAFLAAAPKEGGHWPELISFVDSLNAGIDSHYLASSLDSEESFHRLGLFHFDREVQTLITELDFASRRTEDFGWKDHLKAHFGEGGARLLSEYALSTDGVELVLTDPTGNALEFQRALHQVLKERGMVSYARFASQNIGQLKEKIRILEAAVQASEAVEPILRPQIEALGARLQGLERQLAERQVAAEPVGRIGLFAVGGAAATAPNAEASGTSFGTTAEETIKKLEAAEEATRGREVGTLAVDAAVASGQGARATHTNFGPAFLDRLDRPGVAEFARAYARDRDAGATGSGSGQGAGGESASEGHSSEGPSPKK